MADDETQWGADAVQGDAGTLEQALEAVVRGADRISLCDSVECMGHIARNEKGEWKKEMTHSCDEYRHDAQGKARYLAAETRLLEVAAMMRENDTK